jgi:poly [ADP-ribose] polymerase
MHDEFVSLQNDWLDQKKQLNMQELWHGTKKSNIISIFKNGFVIPPQNAKHCTGRMFGTGIYLSDQSTKALNYSYGWWSGSRDKNCYMFLCDVMMGREYIPSGSCSSRPFGYDSIFAKAGKSGVINNEMIVPLGQVNPKYLVEFSE